MRRVRCAETLIALAGWRSRWLTAFGGFETVNGGLDEREAEVPGKREGVQALQYPVGSGTS